MTRPEILFETDTETFFETKSFETDSETFFETDTETFLRQKFFETDTETFLETKFVGTNTDNLKKMKKVSIPRSLETRCHTLLAGEITSQRCETVRN